jgi:RimJ/RimL family protein N-acetyltransferase
MKKRKNPKSWAIKEIRIKEEKDPIGQIMLVTYFCKENAPHLEFFIKDEFKHYRNKGIISKELPKYLKKCKKYDVTRIIAVVKKDNLASIKIIEKNDFIKIKEIDDNICYMTDLSFTKEKIIKMHDIMQKYFNGGKYQQN